MKATTILLVLFIASTIILAYTAASLATHPETTYLTTTYTTTTTASLATQPLSNSGYIEISNGSSFKIFHYVQWNSSTPNTFTIANVKFTLWTTTESYTGVECYGAANGVSHGGYAITFPDGSTERMTACTISFNPSTAIQLTGHINPQAGLFIFPATGAVYFLVSS